MESIETKEPAINDTLFDVLTQTSLSRAVEEAMNWLEKVTDENKKERAEMILLTLPMLQDEEWRKIIILERMHRRLTDSPDSLSTKGFNHEEEFLWDAVHMTKAELHALAFEVLMLQNDKMGMIRNQDNPFEKAIALVEETFFNPSESLLNRGIKLSLYTHAIFSSIVRKDDSI